jgi:hypothetical protein
VPVEAGLTDGGQPALVHRITEILLRQLFSAEPAPPAPTEPTASNAHATASTAGSLDVPV